MPVFEIGDYIGDYNDTCYKIIEIHDDKFIIKNIYSNTKYEMFIDYEMFHILRKRNHPDITNYPIGSQWLCLKQSGLLDNNQTVSITDYAISEHKFWICNNNGIQFLANSDELKTIN